MTHRQRKRARTFSWCLMRWFEEQLQSAITLKVQGIKPFLSCRGHVKNSPKSTFQFVLSIMITQILKQHFIWNLDSLEALFLYRNMCFHTPLPASSQPPPSLLPASSSQPKSEPVEHVRLFLGGFGITVNASHRQQQCTIIYWGVAHHVNTFFCCSAIGFGLGSGIFLKSENLTRVKTSFPDRYYYQFSAICTL